MSRGLGKRQISMLQVLASMDAKHPDHYFPMLSIVTRLYAVSLDLQEREEQLQGRRAARRSELEAQAKAGDDNSKHLLFLTEAILYSNTKPNRLGRKRERQAIPHSVEDDVNPSRCMRALERRGLVRGGSSGWFGLTDLGRGMCRVNLAG